MAESEGGPSPPPPPPLPEVDVEAEFEVERVLAEGGFSRVLLATHRRSSTSVALKTTPAAATPLPAFFREFRCGYRVSAHPGVVSAFPVAFRGLRCGRLFFALEPAPSGDLESFRAGGGGSLPEAAVKNAAAQLGAALDFLHSLRLAHRAVRPRHVLVFAPDLSRVKLCDFAAARRDGDLVTRPRRSPPAWEAPEVAAVVANERYHCCTASDAWQLGATLLTLLAGRAAPPWSCPDALADADYAAFQRWQRRRTARPPPPLGRFAPRFLRLLRRLLEHKPQKRAAVAEVNKYLGDAWLLPGAAPAPAGSVRRRRSHPPPASATPSSSAAAALHAPGVAADDEGKSRLQALLTRHGVETSVDQKAASRRLWDWVVACETHQVADQGGGGV